MKMKQNAALIGLVLYVLSVLAFFLEFIAEVSAYSIFYIVWQIHEIFEIIILAGLISGFVLVWRGFKASTQRQNVMEVQLQTAKGELQKAIDAHFNNWGLTEAEKDIALLTIKGLSIDEISKLRETTQGTIKAQSSAIYKKAGVKTRAQLVSALIEDLLE